MKIIPKVTITEGVVDGKAADGKPLVKTLTHEAGVPVDMKDTAEAKRLIERGFAVEYTKEAAEAAEAGNAVLANATAR